MRRQLPLLLVSALWVGPVSATEPASPPDSVPLGTPAVREGISVEMSIEPVVAGKPDEPSALLERTDVRVRYRLTDTNTGAPVAKARPGAWLGRLLPKGLELKEDPKLATCQGKAQAYLGGSVLARPELNLNVYYVVTLNEGPSLSVVDPLFGFGGSKLLAMVDLPAPGEDWALSADGFFLYVSLPTVGQIAVIDTASWRQVAKVDGLPGAGRMLLQSDGKYLWVAYGLAGEHGVAAIDTAAASVAARVALGSLAVDLAAAGDRWLWTAERDAGTVSQIDIRTLAKVQSVAAGRRPVSLAWSDKAQTLFVSHEEGILAVIDGKGTVARRLEVPPGLGQVRVAPDERLALAVNPERDLVHVVDVAAGRIVQTGNMDKGPDQVAFTDTLAYVRHRGSDVVFILPLAGLGRTDDAPVSVIDFPGGQNPPGKMVTRTPAAGIVSAVGEPAVLVANPEDKAVYFYKEGMAAPMGHFQNYGESPRAVLVVDRSLRETAPGVYETFARLPRAGEYDAVMFMNSPRRVQCFRFAVADNPALAKPKVPTTYARALFGETPPGVGTPTTLRFELRDRQTGELKRDLADVVVLATLAPGIWQSRIPARPAGDGYELDLTPPEAGVYYFFVESASARVSVSTSGSMILQVKEPEEKAAEIAR